jgi:hypothetical protein
LNGGSFCKEIYNTVWFNTKSLSALHYLSRGKRGVLNQILQNNAARRGSATRRYYSG